MINFFKVLGYPGLSFRRGAITALLLLFALAGCSPNPLPIQGKRDPGELYDKGMTAYLGERYEEAETTFKTLMNEFPLNKLSVEAQLMLADTYYGMERYEDSASYYTNFSALHPTHPKAAYSMFQKGMSHFKEVLSADRDQTATRKALFAFEDLSKAYPDSTYAPKAKDLISFLRKRLAEREIYIARYYFKSKNYKGALGRLRDVLKNYPDTGFTDTALYFIGESYTKLGEKKLAEDAYSTIISNFPESPFARGAMERLKDS